MYEQQDYLISIMLVISIFACITADFIVRLLSGSVFPSSYELLTIFSCIYYILSPLPFVLWFLYTYKKCGKNFVISKKFALITFIPFIINSILSILSIWFNIYFKVISNNIYQRGDLFFILPVLIYSYLFAAIIFVIKYRKNIKDKFFYSFILNILFPFLANFLQILFIGLPFQYPFFTIALLNLHLNFHDSLIDYDQLTGLFNRRHLINSLKSKIEKARNVDKKLVGIMYDIDKFKIINDSFGHTIGDQAIIDAGIIIEKSLPKNATLSRYGGDEFVSLFFVKKENEIDDVIEKLESECMLFNSDEHSLYHIGISYGFCVYDADNDMGYAEFLSRMDSKMYEIKNIHHKIND